MFIGLAVCQGGQLPYIEFFADAVHNSGRSCFGEEQIGDEGQVWPVLLYCPDWEQQDSARSDASLNIGEAQLVEPS